MKASRLILPASAILLLALTVTLLYRPQQTIQTETRFMMGTYCRIDIPGDPSVKPAMKAAFARLEELDALLHTRNPESPLFEFNKNGTSITNDEVLAILERALTASHETAGAFDLTIAPLIDLWGFYTDKPAVPSTEAIQSVLPLIGTNGIAIANHTLTKLRPGTELDLGGIGQGYAIGQAALILKQLGIESALIDLGGDIYGFGQVNGHPWRIGIKNPRGEGLIERISLGNRAVVTSGDYEHFFEEKGIRYHHILDPSTGHPASDLISVTVLMDDPTLCDAFSTGLFVMGMQKAKAFLAAHPSLDALLIASTGETFMTPGFITSLLPHPSDL